MNEAVVSPSPAGGSRPKGLGFSEGGLAAEAAAAALAIAALLVALSLATDNPATGENWIGRMGGVTAKGLVFTFGRIVAWIVPVTLALAASASWRGRCPAHLPERLLAGFGAAVCACALLALRHADTDLRAQRDAFGGGGALGHWLMHRELAGLGSALGGVGAVVAFGGLMLLALCGAADTRPRTVMTGLAAAAARFRPARIAAAARRGRDLWRRLSEGYGEPPDGSSRPMSAPLPLEPAKTSEPFNPSRGTTAAADLIAPRSPRREDSRVFPFVADPELAAAPAAAATTQAARGFIPDPPSDGGDAHSAFAATAAMATAATLGTGPSGSSGRWRAVAAAAETMAPAPSAPVTAPRSHFGPETEHDRPTWAPRATTEGAATTTATTAGSMSTTREETTDSDEDSVGHIAAVPRDPALSGIADHVMAPRRSVVLEQPTLPLAPQVAVPVVSAPEAAPEAALMPAPAIPVPAYPPAPVSTREPEPKPAITIALPAAVVQPVAEFDSPATSMPPPVAFPDPAARVEPAPPPADIYSGLDDDGGSGAWRAVAAADLAAMTAFDEPPPPLRIESETAPSFPAAPATATDPGPGPAISPVFATSTAHVAPVAPPPPPASEAPVYPVIPARPTESQAAAATVYPVPDTDGFRPIDAYDLPVIDLLDTPPDTAKSLSHDDLAEVSQSLESTLQTFGITATVVQVTQGPTVTRFEMQPAPGVKVSRIASLENDIAMLLKADSVRIIAPVPGKGTVGLEVPNRAPTPVFLREILASDAFRDHKSPLAVALGKTIDDEPFVADLVKMPHLLIAGATGAGKSVCLNSIICSILYRTTPDQVRLLMIDPKMVELKVYEAAPHLLAPVVCDTRKAAAALNWAVEEMEDRLRRMSDLNVRGIEGYNEVARDPESHAKGRGKVFDTMPYIVVIIDELADLMITAKNEVEQPIIRLGQMSRATGIHLILATQRPSVNVITGLIKANFPSRIAFKVSSKIDSRTILDGSGAETLLGRGDMLYLANGTPKPMRLQGCFVSDQEVGRVVDWVKEQREADYIREEFKTAQEIAAERVAMMEEAAEEQRQNDAAARRAAMPARPLGPPRPMLRPTANGLILDGREGRPGSSPVPPPPGERRAEYDDRADGEVDFSAAAAGAGSYLSSGVPGEGDSVDDELFRQSVRCVLQHRRASVSLLQKRLKIGFVRASRVMDMMEDAGIVGPAIDGKVREFNVDPDEYLAQIEEDERDGL